MIRLKECDIDEFNELIIDEIDKFYLIRILDSRDGEIAIKYEKNEISKVLDFIYMFLQMENICRVKGRLPVVREENKKNYVEIDGLDGRKLKLNLFNFEFKTIYKVILNKYELDRNKVLNNRDINNVKVNAEYQNYMYKVDDKCLNITLCTDNNGNVISSEVEFMTKYLCDKFASIAEEVSIGVVDDNAINKEWNIRCGDFEMRFPRGFTYSSILSIVNEYDNRFNKRKKR